MSDDQFQEAVSEKKRQKRDKRYQEAVFNRMQCIERFLLHIKCGSVDVVRISEHPSSTVGPNLMGDTWKGYLLF